MVRTGKASGWVSFKRKNDEGPPPLRLPAVPGDIVQGDCGQEAETALAGPGSP